jgi:protein phosphatase
VDIATRSDTGREREVNEDDVLAEPMASVDGHLVAVADGMGGHNAGDVASETALEQFQEIVARELDRAPAEEESALRAGVSEANRELRSMAEGNPEYAEMGTTLVGALLTDGTATIVNVGDSRCYRIDDEIDQVTTDQSFVQQLVEAGQITPEEARDHPKRNLVSQALGLEESVDTDSYETTVNGATMLLCSDGLTEECSDTEIHDHLQEADSSADAADRLVDAANENGGSDNVSVVVARAADGS